MQKVLKYITLMLSVPMFLNAASIDFNSYSAGGLNGQDNWVTTKFNTAGDAFISSAYGPDASSAVKFTKSGAGVGVDGSRLNDLNFSYAFDNNALGVVEFDLIPQYWGVSFGLGMDVDNDNKIESNELGFRVMAQSYNDNFRFNNYSDPEMFFALSSINRPNDWVRIRMDIDFAANSGAGEVSFSYSDPVSAPNSYSSIASMQNLSMGLDPNALDERNAENWEGVWFHFEGSTGALDNISITSQAVPEPSIYVLLTLGLVGIGVYRKRRALKLS